MAANTADPIGTPLGNSGKTIHLGTSRLCDLEAKLGQPFGVILESVADRVDVTAIRECVRAGLVKHHPEDAKLSVVDDLIDTIGTGAAAAAVVTEMTYTVSPSVKRPGAE